MAFVKNIVLEFGLNDPTEYFPLYCAKSAEISLNTELLKVTDTINGKFNKVIPVGISGSMSVSGLVRIDSDFGLFDVAQLLLDMVPVKVRYTITDTNGLYKYFYSDGVIATLGASGSVFSLAENNIEITLSGIIQIS